VVKEMRPKNVWKKRGICLTFMFSLLMLTLSIVTRGSCNEETCVDVKFEILTGSGIQDYYAGDHFWYNITVANSGTTIINATFTVTVRNTTGGILGQVKSYKKYLEPNDTTILYPNYTRLGKDEVFIYFMDTAGTYTITLTCDVHMSFYRYYTTGRYTVEHDKCHMGIDAMPSYQKLQNERWNQYLQESKDYMDTVQTYIEQSRRETSKTQALAFASVLVAMVAIAISIITLPKTRRERFRTSILYAIFMIIAILVFVVLNYLA
jgi:hypothetical protein